MPTAATTAGRERRNGDLLIPRPTPHGVGWAQREGDAIFDPDDTTLQLYTGVKFDLAKLEEIPPGRLAITEAELSYREEAFRWTDGDGEPQGKPGCVGALHEPTGQNWQDGRPLNVEYDLSRLQHHVPGSDLKSSTLWDVSDELGRHLEYHSRGYRGLLSRGIVLGPALVNNSDLTGDDNAACLSKISDIKLVVRFATLP
jgi:hypothetical protein